MARYPRLDENRVLGVFRAGRRIGETYGLYACLKSTNLVGKRHTFAPVSKPFHVDHYPHASKPAKTHLPSTLAKRLWKQHSPNRSVVHVASISQ
jgi:hypothetical protein